MGLPTREAVLIESFLQVVDKEGTDVPFVLNSAQRAVDEELTGRDIIPKARQEGVSTYFLARYTVKCIADRNIRAAIISHEAEATQRLLARCKYFIENYRSAKKPRMSRNSLNVIEFLDTNSIIYIGTAGSKVLGRGDTINHLHCSEYAYWENGKSLFSGIADSVPMSGEIAIESTGNGVGNDYHRRCIRSAQGDSYYKLHFLPWNEFDEYRIKLSDEQRLALLANLSEKYYEVWWEDTPNGRVKRTIAETLSPEQIAWRRVKLEEKDFDIRLFKQEYPQTLDECFQASSNSLFHKIPFEKSSNWVYSGDNLYTLDPHPVEGLSYVIGVDPSGGTGNDNAVAEIFCLETGEQVGEYASNTKSPDDLGATKLPELGRMFNECMIIVESNNHGIVTLNELGNSDYPTYMVYAGGNLTTASGIEDPTLLSLGIRTTSRTKPMMIGELRKKASWGHIKIYSEALRDEMSTFTDKDGKLQAMDGCNDDRVIAAAMASIGWDNAAIMAQEFRNVNKRRHVNDDFALDAIIRELHDRGRKFPFSRQII